MLGTNPFAVLAATIPAAVIQWYVVLMIVLVAAGTLFDIVHKGSARYFFDNWRRSRNKGKHVEAGELASIAVKTAMVDVLASGEFCNPRRRIAHLLTMYGFILHFAAAAALVFWYPTELKPRPDFLPHLWWIGGIMILVGGYWFWFFIRVDVAAEGNSPFRFVRADLFIVALVLSATFGLVWAYAQTRGNHTWATVFLALYLISTTVLFGSIPWSKFSHMFFKPAAALQKRVAEANGTRANLPPPAEAPKIYGRVLGQPRHY